MPSKEAINFCLTMMSCWLIAEAYLMPPRGLLGTGLIMKAMIFMLFVFGLGAAILTGEAWVKAQMQ
jgi:hypothetical protein